jgi:hypothetical protein
VKSEQSSGCEEEKNPEGFFEQERKMEQGLLLRIQPAFVCGGIIALRHFGGYVDLPAKRAGDRRNL